MWPWITFKINFKQKIIFPEILEWMKGFCEFSILQGFKEKSFVHIVKKIALNGKLYIIHEYDN